MSSPGDTNEGVNDNIPEPQTSAKNTENKEDNINSAAGSSCGSGDQDSSAAGSAPVETKDGKEEEVKFKKLKLSHRKYRPKDQDCGGQDVEDVSPPPGASGVENMDEDSSDSDDLNPAETRVSSSSSTDDERILPLEEEEEEGGPLEPNEEEGPEGQIRRRMFRYVMDSSDSEDENEEDNLDDSEERRQVQEAEIEFRARNEACKLLDEIEVRSRNEACKLLDKPAPAPSLNLLREVYEIRLGSGSTQTFKRKLCSSKETVKRFGLYSKLEGHEGCVNALDFNQTGNRIASGSDDLMIKIWDWERRKQVVSFPTGHRENVFQSKFVSGDLLIASCSRDGQVMLAQLCPAGSLRSTSRLAQHRGPAHKMCLIQEQEGSPILLSAGEDGQVISVDIREENSNKIVLLKNDKGRKIPLYSIHNNPVNRNQFCTAGRDPYIRIFDRRYIGNAKQGEMAKFCPTELRTTKSYITSAVFNYSGEEIIGSYSDDDIYLFDISQDENTNYKSRFRGHRNSATVKGVNYYGGRSEYVISGSDCGNVFFWDKETEGIVNIFHGDDNGVVNVLESHPTLPVLATSGLDEEVKVWLPTLSMNDSEEKKILKKKKDYMLRTISSNLVEKEKRMEDTDPVYGHLLWRLWRNIRRGDRERREAAAAALGEGGEPGQQLQEEEEEEDSDDDSEVGEEEDDSDDEDGPPGLNCAQS